jgi:NADPH:quinone reductase-like Zn-dependent oxidoreductase
VLSAALSCAQLPNVKAYEIQKFGIDELVLADRAIPVPGPTEVQVRIHAASLNYRDLRMIEGLYNPRLKLPLVPFSDGAGEVTAVGSEVSKWKVGDRVCPIFIQEWIDGEISFEKARTALGGDRDGVLREFAVFGQEGLVRIPEHLGFEEAATLPCAAVTAWNCLVVSGRIKAGETLLVQGTGGVSIFALQIAKAFGARVIVTSSSDAKLERAKALGADELINYRETPDWEKRVSDLTERRGVDHVVEVGGAGTLSRSIASVRMGGHIALVGVLAGNAEINWIPIFMKAIRLQGLFVGSRAMFEEMNDFLERHVIHPVVDKVCEFGNVNEALKTMAAGSHFGKIVVRVSGDRE